MSEATEIAAFAPEFTEPKKRILWHLKVLNEAGLDELAKKMKISRMAVHKHLVALEERGLVESVKERKGVGRPRNLYLLSSQSKSIFPKSYGGMAICALQFIERNMGRKGVEKVLRERQSDLFKQYYDRLQPLNLEGRVRELAKTRDNEGYMAEPKKLPSGKFLIMEYNCPVIQIAQQYWEACSTERELFESLLGTSVETTHRAAKGDLVCRFVIDPKSKRGRFT
jgi:predicted ArsR family transcriptional regulator